MRIDRVKITTLSLTAFVVVASALLSPLGSKFVHGGSGSLTNTACEPTGGTCAACVAGWSNVKCPNAPAPPDLAPGICAFQNQTSGTCNFVTQNCGGGTMTTCGGSPIQGTSCNTTVSFCSWSNP